MSGYYTQPDPDEQLDNSGGGLRKLLEQTLEENKKLRESIEGGKRQETVTGLLKGMGLDPAVADLIPKDADPKGWLDERAHLFGVKKADEEEAEAIAPETQVAPDDDPAVVAEKAALAQMEDAQASGSQATVTPDLLEKVENAQSADDLMKLFREGGFEGSLSGF